MSTIKELSTRKSAIDYWNSLLSSGSESLIEQLKERQATKGLSDGNNIFCNVARPRFLTCSEIKQEYEAVSALVSSLYKVLEKVLDDFRNNTGHFIELNEWIKLILPLQPVDMNYKPIVRFDSFTTEKGIHFVEMNGDIPLGNTQNDMLISMFKETEILKQFSNRYIIRPVLAEPGLLNAFFSAWRTYGGYGTPKICVLSFAGELWEGHAILTAEYLEKFGIDIVHARPAELEFDGKHLRARGHVVDFIYRVMRTDDCIERIDEMKPFFEALKNNSICVMNPFWCELFSHKYLFTLLTNNSYDFRFTTREKEIIKNHVPWGRMLQEGYSTDPEGTKIELVEYIRQNKNDMVIKPANKSGGKGVLLGVDSSESDWDAAIKYGLINDYIVQRKVDIEVEEYPMLEKGFPKKLFYEDTDPFYYPGGHYAILTRMSTTKITNMKAGGSAVPTFVIESL